MIARTFAGAALVAAALLPAAALAGAPRTSLAAPAVRGVAADVVRTPGLRDLGALRGDRPVRVGLLLRYRHEDELAALVAAQAGKGSRYYHRFLSKAQFANYFAPDAATYARTIATLRRRGFRIAATFPNRGMIEAVAPALVAGRYFATAFRAVDQPGRGVRYVNTSLARMPQDLRADVVAISGLHTTVAMRFPMRIGDVARLRARAAAEATAARERPRPAPNARGPRPAVATTPAPGPDPTESPESPLNDETTYLGYGPPVYAQAYDYPVAHGYDGRGYAAGSVIDTDFSDSGMQVELSTFGIRRTGASHRVCTDADPNACCETGTVAAGTCVYTPDTEGESTLDAQAIVTLAPGADFYEYLSPSFDDIGIEAAYERVVNDDVVVALNSSFGGCETDDPSFEYATNYLAMQGAALGISFSASTGDTGSTACGIYTSNGSPQTDVGVATPAADTYFSAVGGTDFEAIVTGYYTGETAWSEGGGGVSTFEAVPSWQSGVTNVIASGRNVPDLAFTANPNTPGHGFVINFGGSLAPSGGTSLSSPMWVAMLTEMAEEDRLTANGSAAGFGLVNPGLYAALADAAHASYFRDVTVGSNGPTARGSTSGVYGYTALPGYDQTTGAGTPLGFPLGAFLR